ncbi:unnamed protein product [Dracunculus medinensis]|uniref:non-specific serine/threonine protein kinase n=1 Tax=Dracunculus medinensis TaxID=318479 RepID=A0A3P7SML3_DRAME|nr:unnamed protein product [Dracunculus medinensis]
MAASDVRRWSIASLPSSSGCGTPESISAFSSDYSSQEHLTEMLNDLNVVPRFDSTDVYPLTYEPPLSYGRQRSCSLTSHSKIDIDFHTTLANRNVIFSERFPKAKKQMEDRLQQFLEENAPLSGTSSFSPLSSVPNSSIPQSIQIQSFPPSPCFVSSSANERAFDFCPLQCLSDGATRFIHHQIVEIASDCLTKSREGHISGLYFYDVSQRLEQALSDANEKASIEGGEYLLKLVRNLLMIISRTARLLECLEFNPDEFYHMLENTEGEVREQLGASNVRIPDLPQYILTKLGLNKDNLLTTADIEIPAAMDSSFESTVNSLRPSLHLDKPPCEDDYETIRLVSNGAYGAVYLVRHRETRERFAMKKMNKQTLIMRNQVEQVYAERDILTFADNPFVVSFYGSFETRTHLCMLMEYVEGGDCAALLKSVGALPIDIARLYIAETVLAIDYLHSNGIVHRDLKPDNLLITAMGHIKLTDFGLSKIGLMNRTTILCEGYMDLANMQQFKDKQLCGTPEYIAPEVILRQGYGKPVDWWALGIILYEFLIGIVPFVGDTPDELFSNIINDEVEFPREDEALPPDAESLINHLLQKNPIERLGSTTGAQELMIESFFSVLNFNLILREKAEFIPQLENEDDTSYFDTRSDRYNHDAESGDDDSTPMFGSFNTASPRHSVVGIESLHDHRCLKKIMATTTKKRICSNHFCTVYFSSKFVFKMFQALLLRRRFSAQRNNPSSSSSGTTGTHFNTQCSSTDSSMDASYYSDLPTHPPLSENCRKNVTSPLPRKGPNGFGFTVRSIRIYLSEKSEYYKIEHVIASVDEESPAYKAGLRLNDLITHVQSQPVSNFTNPQLIHRMIACGNELSLKIIPFCCTSFREGAARHSVGKLVKKKPRRPQRRLPLEKKTRKTSLLRRFSGKRINNDIVPGSSSQKQAFMPRSGLKHKVVVDQRGQLKNMVVPMPVSPLASNQHIAVSPLARQEDIFHSPLR